MSKLWRSILAGTVSILTLLALVLVVLGGQVGVPETAVLLVAAVAGVALVVRRARRRYRTADGPEYA
ncbi:hypothetical protein AB0J38_14595 [Streptomyces sp. NPDC050095]|uniref:hypothetical protein n=1 Tax=unclassified Streptomyces TaxID=2593676 RepID=UPI00344A4EBB